MYEDNSPVSWENKIGAAWQRALVKLIPKTQSKQAFANDVLRLCIFPTNAGHAVAALLPRKYVYHLNRSLLSRYVRKSSFTEEYQAMSELLGYQYSVEGSLHRSIGDLGVLIVAAELVRLKEPTILGTDVRGSLVPFSSA